MRKWMNNEGAKVERGYPRTPDEGIPLHPLGRLSEETPLGNRHWNWLSQRWKGRRDHQSHRSDCQARPHQTHCGASPCSIPLSTHPSPGHTSPPSSETTCRQSRHRCKPSLRESQHLEHCSSKIHKTNVTNTYITLFSKSLSTAGIESNLNAQSQIMIKPNALIKLQISYSHTFSSNLKSNLTTAKLLFCRNVKSPSFAQHGLHQFPPIYNRIKYFDGVKSFLAIITTNGIQLIWNSTHICTNSVFNWPFLELGQIEPGSPTQNLWTTTTSVKALKTILYKNNRKYTRQYFALKHGQTG